MEVMVSEGKQKLIEELTEVIDRADSFLHEICKNYQWDIKSLEKVAEENYIMCPFDKNHVVPERSMQRHLEACEWKTLGYTKDCKPLPESTVPPDSAFFIKFDMELQFKVLQEARQKAPYLDIGTDEKLIPQTSDRLTSDFTRDERKALYEYVVAHTLSPDVGQDITDLNKPEKKEERSASLLELLAQERNLKRRKARYRGVHTNKKSHTEIMREVVQQQMEMYKEYLVEKYGVEVLDDQENSSNIKDETCSSPNSDFSSSKHISRERSRDSHRSKDYGKNCKENPKHQNHSSDSHRSHSRDYNDKLRESHKNYDRDYCKSSRHSSQYENRDHKDHSKDSSKRHDYRYDDEYNYKSRNRYEDKHYSRNNSNKNIVDITKKNRDKSNSSRDGNISDKSYSKDKDSYRDNRKRDRSFTPNRKSNFKSKDDSNSYKYDEKHENKHKYKQKKQKSDKSNKEKKHKKSKHKRKSRSRSTS